jgi:hypothetical protein
LLNPHFAGRQVAGSGCRPFRADLCCGGLVPRALPWADEFRRRWRGHERGRSEIKIEFGWSRGSLEWHFAGGLNSREYPGRWRGSHEFKAPTNCADA